MDDPKAVERAKNDKQKNNIDDVPQYSEKIYNAEELCPLRHFQIDIDKQYQKYNPLLKAQIPK